MFGLFRYLQLVMVQKTGDTPTDLVTRDKGIIGAVRTFISIFLVLMVYTRGQFSSTAGSF